MIAERFDQPRVALQPEVKAQQRSDGQRLLLEVLRQRTSRRLEGLDEGIGHLVYHRMWRGRVRRQRLRLLEQALQSRASRRRGRGDRCTQRFQGQLGAVHLSRALHQVVGLVDQRRQLPVQGLEEAPELPVAVEQVVHIAHQHVGPAHEFLPEVVGADLVTQGHLALRRGIEPAPADRLLACEGEPVVEPSGQRARVTVAGLVGVHARLVLRRHGQNAQRLT